MHGTCISTIHAPPQVLLVLFSLAQQECTRFDLRQCVRLCIDEKFADCKPGCICPCPCASHLVLSIFTTRFVYIYIYSYDVHYFSFLALTCAYQVAVPSPEQSIAAVVGSGRCWALVCAQFKAADAKAKEKAKDLANTAWAFAMAD